MEELISQILCCLLLGYLLGSLNPSFVVGKLSGYDVLVMPGGSGYDRYSQLGEEGFEKIRKYIREGGA